MEKESKDTMTSRERMKITLSHKEADRVPCHMNATLQVVVKLKQALGVTTDRQLLDALHIDTFDMRGITIRDGIMPEYVGENHPTMDASWKGNIIPLWGIAEEESITEFTTIMNQASYPLKDAKTLKELKAYRWPDPDWFDYHNVRERIAPWADRSIILTGASVFQHPSYVRSMEILMMDLILEPAMADYIFDRFTEFYLEFFTRILKAAGDLIDCIALADDLGTQNSLMISPDLFKTFVKPRIKRFANLAHSSGCALILHTDGNIRSIIPDIIDAGVDVLDPLQPEAEQMCPYSIKKEFGKELVLRGGISTQQTLSKGSVEEVRDEVRRTISQMAYDGGYILAPGHPVLQNDIPTDNIIAMYDAAIEFGSYL
ncbi:MAG: uroporphyrinogen decarboxylase family protein [Sphaerochaetaceae bacterium]|jgi:uroporphyrinogen decarboxylase|nr:uroporphyrinogen decarboxylase family protein [Sphaerochaetaceae bacterium]